MKRLFYVIHSHGIMMQSAETAREAVRKAFIPAGYRVVFAVIDEAALSRGGDSRGPFTALGAGRRRRRVLSLDNELAGSRVRFVGKRDGRNLEFGVFAAVRPRRK